jgi:hypothetical protein
VDKLLNEFESYCETPGIDSGKASSYSRAIRYLCDFWGVKIINDDVVLKMKSIESFISMPNSRFYKDLLAFLDNRRQSSYLRKGFIKAALNYFFTFWSHKQLNTK